MSDWMIVEKEVLLSVDFFALRYLNQFWSNRQINEEKI